MSFHTQPARNRSFASPGAGAWRCIPTHPQAVIKNTQAEGIGRLCAIGDHLAINNLGRNIELSRPARHGLDLEALFVDSAFPHDDEGSQYDLDMHAFLVDHAAKAFIAINHFGLVRVFPHLPAAEGSTDKATESTPRFMKAGAHFRWPADVEQFAWVGPHLVSTSPRGFEVDEPAMPGIVIAKDPWDKIQAGELASCAEPVGDVIAHQIRWRQELAEWGYVTAMVSDWQRSELLAVAAGRRIGLFEPSITAGAQTTGHPIWEAELPFSCNWLRFDRRMKQLVAAGYDPEERETDDGDWCGLKGGGFALIDLSCGSICREEKFSIDLAWGNGGVPLVMLPDSDGLLGVDRRGGLYLLDMRGSTSCLIEPPPGQDPLGVAHMVCVGPDLFCGFNRAGYQLFHYRLA